MTADLGALAWSASRLGEAMEVVAARTGLSPRAASTPAGPPEQALRGGDEPLGLWIEAHASALGLDAESLHGSHGELPEFLRGTGPALLRLPGDGEPRFLVLLATRRNAAVILTPGIETRRLPLYEMSLALSGEEGARALAEASLLLEEARIPVARRRKARDLLVRERLKTALVSGCYVLSVPPEGSVRVLARLARLPRRVAVFGLAHLAQYALWLLSWWFIGRGALEGRLDEGFVLAWALMLLTLVPIRVLGTWSAGVLGVTASGLLKMRLLAGALKLKPEEVRHQGAGQLLGRVVESEAVESLALSGGFLGLVAVIEIVAAGVVLGLGAGGGLHVFALLAWVAFSLLLGWRFFVSRRAWTEERLALTHGLVERLVGHRTRIAQEGRERWHEEEDAELARYVGLSRAMDGRLRMLASLVPRGWLLVGLLGLGPAFVGGNASEGSLAVGLGGILLAYEALLTMSIGMSHLTGAALSWKQVRPLYEAASRGEALGSPAFAAEALADPNGGPGPPSSKVVMEAHDVTFCHPGRREAVIKNVDVRVDRGDRVLLEGSSGCGKSTLASILTGLRAPDSGLLLLGGLDRNTLGSRQWRRRVAAAPQFNENHVLTGTFAFNLLMGRRWPPSAEDVSEAETLCGELGLGPLLARMPGGLLQVVGETGWQLSHGERSRLYMARALLQGADLVILDETFAALDPETLKQTLTTVLRRAPTLLVIAHP